MAAQVDTLLEDHRNMHQVSRKFANLVEQLIEDATMPRDAFIKAAVDYVDFQRNHMMREVSDVLPAALRVLTAEDWAELEAAPTKAKIRSPVARSITRDWANCC